MAIMATDGQTVAIHDNNGTVESWPITAETISAMWQDRADLIGALKALEKEHWDGLTPGHYISKVHQDARALLARLDPHDAGG